MEPYIILHKMWENPDLNHSWFYKKILLLHMHFMEWNLEEEASS